MKRSEDKLAVIMADMAAGRWSSARRAQLAAEWGLVGPESLSHVTAEASRRIRMGNSELAAAAVGGLEETLRRCYESGTDRALATAASICQALLGHSSMHAPPTLQAARATIRYLAEHSRAELRQALRDEAELVREALESRDVEGLE